MPSSDSLWLAARKCEPGFLSILFEGIHSGPQAPSVAGQVSLVLGCAVAGHTFRSRQNAAQGE